MHHEEHDEELRYDGFRARLGDDWEEELDDETFSDPDHPPPMTFVSRTTSGRMQVQRLLFFQDEQPSAHPEECERIALAWGKSHSLTPVSVARDSTPAAGIASATFAVGGEHVEVWVVSNGDGVVRVSYTCSPEEAGRDRDALRRFLHRLRITVPDRRP